jgi:hypothetical protein
MSALKSLILVTIALALAVPGRAQEPDPTFKSDLLGRVVDGENMLPARWQNREEVLAYETLVLHARQFDDAALAKSARRGLNLRVLLGPDKAQHRGQLIHLEGSLRLLEPMELSAGLTGMADGLTNVYRGWIALDGYKDDLGPVLCAVDFTEIPAGLTPANAPDRHVSVDGYFFKVMKYDTREPHPGGVSEQAPDGKVARLALLFVAKTVQAKAPPTTASSPVWEIPAVAVGGAILLVAVAVGAWLAISWWMRREDARVRARLQQLRPGAFAESAAGDGMTDLDENNIAGRGPFGPTPSAN